MRIKRELYKTSRDNLPALWENYTFSTNGRSATIVADSRGLPMVPVYVPRWIGKDPPSRALFKVNEGTIVVEAFRNKDDLHIQVWRIEDIEQTEDGNWQASWVRLAEFKNGVWDNESVAMQYMLAIDAAVKGVTSNFCMGPLYLSLRKRRNI